MTAARLALLVLVAITLTAIVGSATTLDVDVGSLFLWSKKVDALPSPDGLDAEFHRSTPTVVLTWEAVGRAARYRLYRRPEGGSFERIASPTAESYNDTGVEKGVRYRYFVTAVGEDGFESEPSNSVSVVAAEPTATPEPTATATPEAPSYSDVTPTLITTATPPLIPEATSTSSWTASRWRWGTPPECANMSLDNVIVGTDGDDDIEGTDRGDLIFGRGGDDHIEGGYGHDCIVGGPGDDDIEGNAGDDRLFGTEGNDVIRGGDHNDRIDGGLGTDTCWGGRGNDTITNCDGTGTSTE